MDEGLSTTVVSDIASLCTNIDADGENTGLDRLKSIVTSVTTNDEIKQLIDNDLSFCTPQTKEMAEQNMAERAASPMNQDNNNGYTPPYSLVELIAITILFASTYSRDNGMAANKTNYLWPFYLFLCGAADIKMPTFFPSPNAKDWNDDNSGRANYLEGSLYTILKQAMPLAMFKIVSGVLSYPVSIASDVLLYFYLIGYIDGDGSYYGIFDGRHKPTLQIAIKRGPANLPIPFVELLRDVAGGCSIKKSGMTWVLGRKFLFDSYWFLAGFQCHTIKRVQFHQIVKSSAATQLAQEQPTHDQTVIDTRAAQTSLLAGANNLHGRIKQSYYEQLFNTMITSQRQLAFPVSLAGMIGADGGVGYNDLKTCCLIQSCKNYCNALANATQQAFDFDDAPSVLLKTDRTATDNSSASFKVYFNMVQSVFCILHIGSFDYRRKCQWLVFLLAVLNREAPPFATKTNVTEFLEDLIKVIRKDELS